MVEVVTADMMTADEAYMALESRLLHRSATVGKLVRDAKGKLGVVVEWLESVGYAVVSYNTGKRVRCLCGNLTVVS